MRPDSICALNITRWYIMVHHHVIRTQSICCAMIGRCRMQRAGYKLRIFLRFFSFLNGGILNGPFLEGLKIWKNTKIGSSSCFEKYEKNLFLLQYILKSLM